MGDEQNEEREVLLSIYDGDGNFFDISPTLYQYKFGEDGDNKSFMIEISWSEEYPNILPEINLDMFYNKHISLAVKNHIKSVMIAQAEDMIGSGSTYTLFEYAKENLEELIQSLPETATQDNSGDQSVETTRDTPAAKHHVEKKEVLSKNQKRRLYDKFGTQGVQDNRQRGWNWVDIIRHLSQTGSKQDGE